MSTARIAGFIAAIIFGIFFVITLFAAIGPNAVVAPTNGVTAGGRSDNPAGEVALPALQIALLCSVGLEKRPIPLPPRERWRLQRRE